MKFAEDVVSFDFAGIPMVGSMATGYAIGLTEEGAAVCARLHVEDVDEREVAAVDPALLEHLTKGGFFSEAPDDRRVMSAYLHVTQRCNLDCAGCYSLDAQRNALADASLADMARAVDELASAGVSNLVISGGEPFLRADLPDIVAHAKAAGIAKATVLSNGTCLTADALARLAPYADCVSVSFDGCSAGSPAYIRGEQRFDELVEAVGMIRAAGISAHIIPTVHAKNVGDLPAYVKLSRDLGATLNFSLLTCEPEDALAPLLPGDEELRALGLGLLTLDGGRPLALLDAPVGLNLTVKRNCGAGYREVSVAADGTVYPCHMLQRPELAMGNVFTGTLAEALESDVSRRFRALDAAEFEGCSSCRYTRICGGGCRARSLFASGNLESRDSYCAMTQAFYDDLGRRMQASLQQRR
ncbi:radical SAM/SPASM domain-containing protein [Arabiibacter massiliensis]|uniref:radical SAM/SPASM domain-containing protein n=1 Tax=Arabiibacter massiliensis TaxID=1870985 RepID=UPI0009BB8379|nr:radical SAM protein [Arabiibacter massiliensis]